MHFRMALFEGGGVDFSDTPSYDQPLKWLHDPGSVQTDQPLKVKTNTAYFLRHLIQSISSSFCVLNP